MAFGVFIHRTDSAYNDVPSEQYQFPKKYLSRARQCEGDWIVYLEPSKVKNSKGYFALARVREIVSDPENQNMFFALIEKGSYLDFGDPVQFRNHDEIVEKGLLNEDGRISGRAQAAVRPISPIDFARIIELGLNQPDKILPRVDQISLNTGFEDTQAKYSVPPRNRLAQLTMRSVRDRNFRKTVLRVYEERCAITGLRLINGGGRAEVQAAHIRPVEYNGPDIITNGMALSGTAHWMFDRGLVSLSNDFEILISRQTNDVDAVRMMINDTGRLIGPPKVSERPRHEFITWHRENCFKQ
jgi:putative restriction endonuclease